MEVPRFHVKTRVRPCGLPPNMRTAVRWIALLVVFAAGAGFLAAVLVPRDSEDRGAPTPVLVTTRTIPAIEP